MAVPRQAKDVEADEAAATSEHVCVRLPACILPMGVFLGSGKEEAPCNGFASPEPAQSALAQLGKASLKATAMEPVSNRARSPTCVWAKPHRSLGPRQAHSQTLQNVNGITALIGQAMLSKRQGILHKHSGLFGFAECSYYTKVFIVFCKLVLRRTKQKGKWRKEKD